MNIATTSSPISESDRNVPVPPVGEILTFTDNVREASRMFICTGSVPYKRKDGTSTTLYCWESTCVACGSPFTILVTANQVQMTTVAGKPLGSFCTIRCEECRSTAAAEVASRKVATLTEEVNAIKDKVSKLRRQKKALQLPPSKRSAREFRVLMNMGRKWPYRRRAS